MNMAPHLFEPQQLGTQQLPNRIVMAPMTRSRTDQPGDVPNQLMAEYYAQRASAGLIVTEATQISPQGKGYSFTPGIYNAEQVAGWKRVTDAVHAQGGRIFIQLWHVGRMSHHSFHADQTPVAPSAIKADAQVWVVGDDGVGRMVDVSMPRALSLEGVSEVIGDYRRAARNAIAAGFDGVEIHAGNGYLIDEFLRTTSNVRDDQYGGSRDNRVRFLYEVASGIAEEIGAARTGVRMAPFITARGMNCPDVIPTILLAAEKLQDLGVSYIHLAEADWDDAPQVPEDFRHQLRAVYHGRVIVAGRYDLQRAEAILAAGLADLVAFGRAFVANPDLPARLLHGWPLAGFDASQLFGGNERGYSDYPRYAATAEPA